MWLGVDERKWDHFRVHLDVLRRGGMGVYEFAAYCGLVAHAEIETGQARPSAATLAAYFGASDRRMREAVGWLEEHHWIRVERIDGKASHYYVLPPPTPAPPAALADSTPEPGAALPLHDVPRTPEPRADEQEPVDKNQGTSAPVARGTRIPDQFFISPANHTWAQEHLSSFDYRAETHNFTDYWRASSGRNATKRDWDAAWRVWMRKAAGTNRPARMKQTRTEATIGRIGRMFGPDQKEIAQ